MHEKIERRHIAATVLNYLAHLTEKESEECEDDEVGAASEVRHFVHLKGGRDCEEDQLHNDGHDRAYGKMVLVQNIDRHSLTTSASIVSDDDDELSQNLEDNFCRLSAISVNSYKIVM